MHHHRGLLHGLYEDVKAVGHELWFWLLLFIVALPGLWLLCVAWNVLDHGKSDTMVSIQAVGLIIIWVRFFRRRDPRRHPEWDSTHGTPRPKYVRPLTKAELNARADRAGAASMAAMQPRVPPAEPDDW